MTLTPILAIAFLLCIIFYNWVGKFLSWILTPIINNPVGAIIVTFLIIIAFARFVKLFMSEIGMQRISFPHRNKKIKKQ